MGPVPASLRQGSCGCGRFWLRSPIGAGLGILIVRSYPVRPWNPASSLALGIRFVPEFRFSDPAARDPLTTHRPVIWSARSASLLPADSSPETLLPRSQPTIRLAPESLPLRSRQICAFVPCVPLARRVSATSTRPARRLKSLVRGCRLGHRPHSSTDSEPRAAMHPQLVQSEARPTDGGMRPIPVRHLSESD